VDSMRVNDSAVNHAGSMAHGDTEVFRWSPDMLLRCFPRRFIVVDGICFDRSEVEVKVWEEASMLWTYLPRSDLFPVSVCIPASVQRLSQCIGRSYPRFTILTFEYGCPVSEIGTATFCNCASLLSVCVPAGCTEIRASCFGGCIGLSAVTFEPGSKLRVIGDTAFRKCSSLPSIQIPASAEKLGDSCFRDCWMLVSVEFERGSRLSEIGEDVFCRCPCERSVCLPPGVEELDNSARRI
jgi:hypothetical protein